ncbi:DUF1178 domain-containing protein [Phyllobacterium phragmitis]|uniref:DUF1178 domain-containing protein n=1 Tax=Phyllobacterium phragmitis TaxID=2670329 RepID=A0A2S9IK99_9HYPH|nr:DUF1178 family protein [Phyllobacterium phragmitis]PRD40938.1 DUF1178 domain-containing protein [Phyllobacterium phragmitis]
MIHFTLLCDQEHEFEGWFRNNEDFDAQAARKLVSCPVCGSLKVEKALMAPSVSTSRANEKIAVGMGEAQRALIEQMRELSRKVREGADFVGDKFAEEARKIHFGETDPRGIYGEATREEVTALVDEGVEIMPLPVFPEDRN